MHTACSAVTLVAASVACAQVPVQCPVASGGNGHWYAGMQLPGSVTPTNWWDEARNRCEAIGGHLATPTSSAENAFIIANAVPQLTPVPGFGRGPMLGGRKEDGAWRWITGEPWVYTGWCGPEPTGDGTNLQYWAFNALCWNDFPGTVAYTNTYIIEWSADCNNDGIVDVGQILDGTLMDADGDLIPDECSAHACNADITRDGVVDGRDLSFVLSSWGEAVNGTDVDGSGIVTAEDLCILLAQWGPCDP